MIRYRESTRGDLEKVIQSDIIQEVKDLFGAIGLITFEEDGKILAVATWVSVGEDRCFVGVLPSKYLRGIRYIRATRLALREIFLKKAKFKELYTESEDTKSLHKWHTVLGFEDRGLSGEGGKRAWVLK